MLRLTDKPREPVRVEVADGVFITFDPLGPLAMKKAGKAYVQALAETGDEDAAGVAFTVAVAMLTAKAWDGVGDAKGKPLKFSPERLGQLLTQHPAVYRKVDQDVVTPALLRDNEKNGSSPSRTGTSGAKTQAKAIASTVAQTPAPNVRTSRNPSRSKAARPGRSSRA